MGQGQGDGKIQKDSNKVVVRVDMDCEACKKRVKKVLKKFPGVEDIDLDMEGQKVTIKGNVDAWKVYEALRKKCGRRTTLVYPQLSKEEERKAKEDSIINSVNKIVESITDLLTPKLPNTIVELRVFMHCGACAKKIRRILLRLDGVTDVEGDMVASKVVVKGRDLDAEVLCNRVKESGKPCELISFKKEEKPFGKMAEKNEKKVEKKEENKEQEGDAHGKKEKKRPKAPGNLAAKTQEKEQEEKMEKIQGKEIHGKNGENFGDKKIENTQESKSKKKKENAESDESKKDIELNEGKQQGKEEAKQTGSEGKDLDGSKDRNTAEKKRSNSGDKKVTMDDTNDEWEDGIDSKKYIYIPSQSLPEYAYAPEIFSDENPNACIVM